MQDEVSLQTANSSILCLYVFFCCFLVVQIADDYDLMPAVGISGGQPCRVLLPAKASGGDIRASSAALRRGAAGLHLRRSKARMGLDFFVCTALLATNAQRIILWNLLGCVTRARGLPCWKSRPISSTAPLTWPTSHRKSLTDTQSHPVE